tara:strand:- start:5733 stop:6962 length:1230 start_codon:yes stop_codon:yes gene_type:complete
LIGLLLEPPERVASVPPALVYLGFFGLGLNLYWVYLPALVIGVPWLLVCRGKSSALDSEIVYPVVAFLLYLFSLFSLGWSNFLWDSTLKSVLVVTFCLTIPVITILFLKPVEIRNAFLFYFSGVVCFILSGVLYTSLVMGLESGRGNIWLPWKSIYVNSPEFANLTALVAAAAVITGVASQSRIILSVSVLFFAGSLGITAFLDARSFYVIMILTFFFLMLCYQWSKILIVYFLSISLYLVASHFSDAIVSLLNDSGLMSAFQPGDIGSTNVGVQGGDQQLRGSFFLRFYLWAEGLQALVINPVGGYRPSGISVWFHNLWLDTASTSGLIPLAFLLILNSGTLIQIILLLKGAKTLSPALVIIQIIVLATMFQDVVIEGNFRLMEIYMLAMVANFYFYSINARSFFSDK